jgi:subfamily B ATP-binding cassette protein MsbA
LKSLINDSQLAIYMRLMRYIKPYSWFFAMGVMAAIPSGCMESLQAWLAGQGLQKIFVEKHEHMIYYVPVAVILIVSLQGLFRFFESYNVRHVGAAAIRDIRNELFDHLQKQPLLYYQNQSSGVLIGRLVNDVAIIEAAISQSFQSLVSRTVTLASLVVVILLQSWQLALIAISILSLIVVPVQIFGRKIRKSSRGGQEAIGDLVSVLSESIQGAKIVQSFNLEGYQVERFTKTNQNFLYNNLKAIKSEALLSPILAFISSLGIAAVIYVAATMVVKHQMTLGSLTTFVVSLLLLYSPIKNIGRINGIIQPALAAASRVFEVLDKQSDLVNCANPIELTEGTHRIKFDHVYFRYPSNENMVLRDVSIDVEPGKMIALVGLSGSGKSTMVNLVPRFFDVTSGAILIDGINVKELELHSLRKQIAVVTQDNFLFNTTVAENIRLGKLDATQAEVEEAAKAAYCHDFILKLPEGYETKIGERGVRLSGGQQQRLAIARAFLKNAPLLIMDEATSSLDNESEAMVQEALNNLMEGRTVVVIAHRLSTVRHADQIYVLDHGQVLEKGTHDELVALDATYNRLIRAQFERPVS